jgi:hypothetical protein|tara:strand:- start:861 stop:1217 length:357 start_codon:yes stop_codon:yes gene_type:complete
MQATIKSVSPCFGKSYNKGIRVSVLCEDGKYASSWIGDKAPEWVSENWWKLINEGGLGWTDFVSEEVWRLLNLEIEVECEETEYGRNIIKVLGLSKEPTKEPVQEASTTTAEIDDIPF